MKKIKKVLLSLALVCVACVTAGLCIIKTTSAEEIAVNAATENVYMRDGASVNVSQSGVRFGAYVNKAWYDALENKETGVYVIPADLLGENQLTDATENAVSAVATAAPIVEGDYYLYNYVLRNIPAEAYGRKLVARAYVKSGDTYTWANNAQSRSLAYVASAALQKASVGEATFDAAQTTTLKNYVDGAIASIAPSAYTKTLTVGGGEDSVSLNITPKTVYTSSDELSDLKAIYTSDNAEAVSVADGKLTANKGGYARIRATLGSKTQIIRVYSNEEPFYVSATAETQTMEYSLPAGVSAEIGWDQSGSFVSWGSVSEGFSVPSTLKEDKTQHKLYPAGWLIKIVIDENDTATRFTRPSVALVTATINNADDWKTYMWCADKAAIYGYYILGKSLNAGSGTLQNPLFGGNLTNATTGGDYGFRGTLDGKGNTVGFWGSCGGGLVNALGAGALVKNITISKLSAGYNPGWKSNQIFGAGIVGATLDNVTINIEQGDYSAIETKYGFLSYAGFRNSTVNGLTINVKNNVKLHTVIGGDNAYFQTCGTKFTNCVVNLYPGAELGEIGHTGASGGTPIYCGENQTIEGRTPLTGFTVNEIGVTNTQLNSVQDVSVVTEAAAIDLGEYSDYTVTSITCEGEDLGQDAKNLVLSETIKKKQGNE